MSDTLSPTAPLESIEDGYYHLRETCGLVDLTSNRVLYLTGEDRKGWLQGQVTNDLRKLQPGGSIKYCLCTPTGQLEAICTMWSLDDRFIVTTPEPCVAPYLDRVANNVIMEDVAVESPAVRLLSLQGPEATRELTELVELPTLDVGKGDIEGTPVVLMRSNRTGYGGWDIVVDASATGTIAMLESRFPAVPREAYRLARIESGFPEFGIDTEAKTLPPELGQAFMAAHVSHNKGCYTGQEVLMRIYSRGHVNRQWVGLYCEGPVAAGDVVSSANKPEIGRITSAGNSPEMGPIAAAIVRGEFAEQGEMLTVKTSAGDIPVEVQPMPLLRMG